MVRWGARCVVIYSFLAIGLEFIVWLVPSRVGGAIAIAFTGMLLSSMLSHRHEPLLPHWILTSGVLSYGSAVIAQAWHSQDQFAG